MSTPEDAAVIEAALAALTPSAAQSAPAAPGAEVPRCDNCGTAVPGRFCGNCGQRLEAPLRSLWHFLKLAAEDVTHADSRLWRTLWALLVRPGFLTRQFLSGHRASYLPPVRLYLVLSVAFFLFAAAAQPKLAVLQLGHDPAHGGRLVYRAGPLEGAPAATSGAETPEQRAARMCANVSYDGPWKATIAPRLPATCRKIVEDGGRRLSEDFLHNLPRAMFVFLPLLAGIMTLLYWRPRHYYVEHLLLLVHNHAFVFVAVMLAWVAGILVRGLPGLIKFALCVYFVWYMYRSMRVAYGQGRLLTTGKLLVLGFFYFVFGMFMLVLTSLYSAYTL
jgi:hypothetical protein